jgi:sortase B
MAGNGRQVQEGQAARKKGRAAPAVLVVVLIAAAAVFVLSLVNISDIMGGYASSQNAYRELRETYTTSGAAEVVGGGPGSAAGGVVDSFSVDFNALEKISPDVAAWIRLPGTNIDYPVAAAADDEYYVSHSFDGTENRSGAIFLDKDNRPDFSDGNTIIYGHNMKDGSMFAALHEYENEAFFLEHPDIFIYTPDGSVRRYVVFSAYVADAVESSYKLTFASEDEFLAYAERARARSAADTGVTISGNDRILTLSTCVSGRDDKRYVVMGVEQPE